MIKILFPKMYAELLKGLKYINSFTCTDKACGNGALCNSCWAKRWANAFLDILGIKDKKYEVVYTSKEFITGSK